MGDLWDDGEQGAGLAQNLLDYMEMLTNAHKLILIPCLYLHLEAEQLQCPGLQRKAAGMLT